MASPPSIASSDRRSVATAPQNRTSMLSATTPNWKTYLMDHHRWDDQCDSIPERGGSDRLAAVRGGALQRLPPGLPPDQARSRPNLPFQGKLGAPHCSAAIRM